MAKKLPKPDTFLLPTKKLTTATKEPATYWKTRDVYKVGDGDKKRFIREGADHSHLKSFGLKT